MSRISLPVSVQADQLVTNEYAYLVPDGAGVHVSPTWETQCGSLFLKDGAGWTGAPVDGRPVADKESRTSNNSAQLRLLSKRADFLDHVVSLNLRIERLTEGNESGLPAQVYDGVHIFTRWQSAQNLYAASVALRSGTVVIKRKYPGGPTPSNGGTYYPLAPAVTHPAPLGRWFNVQVAARTLPDGNVSVGVSIDGAPVLCAVDTGAPGVAPVTTPGRVGIRGDNAEFQFSDFEVAAL
jgi:hypothetical protein